MQGCKALSARAERQHVIPEAINWVLRGRETRSTEPASRDAVHVVIGRELRCKLVEHMRGVPAAGQENDGLAGTAPIQHFQLNALFDTYKPHSV